MRIVILFLALALADSQLERTQAALRSVALEHAEIADLLHSSIAASAGLHPMAGQHNANFAMNKSVAETLGERHEFDAVMKSIAHAQLSSHINSLADLLPEKFASANVPVMQASSGRALFQVERPAWPQAMSGARPAQPQAIGASPAQVPAQQVPAQAQLPAQVSPAQVPAQAKVSPAQAPAQAQVPAAQPQAARQRARQGARPQQQRPPRSPTSPGPKATTKKSAGARARLSVPMPAAPQVSPSGKKSESTLAACTSCRLNAEGARGVTRAQVDAQCQQQCAAAPPQQVEQQFMALAQRRIKGSAECPNSASLSKTCLKQNRVDLIVMGISGTAGAAGVLAGTGGLEAVLDYDTSEVAFFRYGGHYIGSDVALANAGGQIYYGAGWKGKSRGTPIGKAYVNYFLCATVGANLFGGVAGTLCASAASPTRVVGFSAKPDFTDVTSAVVGLTLSFPTSPVTLGMALPNYALISSHKCEHPACVTALLAFSPVSAREKADALIGYMEKYCAKPKHSQGSTCRVYRVTKEWIGKQVASMKKFGKDLRQMVRDNILESEMMKSVRRSADQVELGLERLRDSPELRPDVQVDVPTRRGAYIKINSCGIFPKPAGSDPYWACNQNRKSEVGLKRREGQKEKFFWDYDADQRKTGFGMFFAGNQKCVACELYERYMWPRPDKATGFKFQKCNGGMQSWQPTPVKDRSGKTVSTCSLKYQYNN